VVAEGFFAGLGLLRGFVKSLKPPLKLSLQALETLAVVAYKQPVTAPEISEIRGVDSGGVLGGLIARKLITTAGRKQVIGRPILYKTTKDFLVRFGLKDINELPSIEEFEKMAGELADADPVQEEIPMPQQHEDEGGESPSEESGSEESGSEESSLDERDAAPESTTVLHETPEDLESDKSVAPEGHEHEHTDPHEVEPMADVHEPQSDGDSTPTDEEAEEK
jgi:segregation and condensation protein B